MLECENNSIYTGITSDIERRFLEHLDTKKSRKGAKFTRSFKPKQILAAFSVKDRSSALKLEALIKKQDKATKISIVDIYVQEHLLKPQKLYIKASKIKSIFNS